MPEYWIRIDGREETRLKANNAFQALSLAAYQVEPDPGQKVTIEIYTIAKGKDNGEDQ